MLKARGDKGFSPVMVLTFHGISEPTFRTSICSIKET